MTLNFEEYKKIHEECLSISKRKNADYGSEGLKRFGVMGITTRISDKTDRLVNLTWRKQAEVKDESIEDTLKDLINYATYAIMMQRGKLENENRD